MRMAAWLSACPPSSALRISDGLDLVVMPTQRGEVRIGVAVAAFTERDGVVDVDGEQSAAFGLADRVRAQLIAPYLVPTRGVAWVGGSFPRRSTHAGLPVRYKLAASATYAGGCCWHRFYFHSIYCLPTYLGKKT